MVEPGQRAEVLIIDPLEGVPQFGGNALAGRYEAAVRTNAGWARTPFYVEFSDDPY